MVLSPTSSVGRGKNFARAQRSISLAAVTPSSSFKKSTSKRVIRLYKKQNKILHNFKFQIWKKSKGLRTVYIQWRQGEATAAQLRRCLGNMGDTVNRDLLLEIHPDIIFNSVPQSSHEPPSYDFNQGFNSYHIFYRVDYTIPPPESSSGTLKHHSIWLTPGGGSKSRMVSHGGLHYKRWKLRSDGYEARCYNLGNGYMYLHVVRIVGFNDAVRVALDVYGKDLMEPQVRTMFADSKLSVLEVRYAMDHSNDWKSFLHVLTCIKYKRPQVEYVEGQCPIAYALGASDDRENPRVTEVVRLIGMDNAKSSLRLNGQQGFVSLTERLFPKILRPIVVKKEFEEDPETRKRVRLAEEPSEERHDENEPLPAEFDQSVGLVYPVPLAETVDNDSDSILALNSFWGHEQTHFDLNANNNHVNLGADLLDGLSVSGMDELNDLSNMISETTFEVDWVPNVDLDDA